MLCLLAQPRNIYRELVLCLHSLLTLKVRILDLSIIAGCRHLARQANRDRPDRIQLKL
jgi:hypothetical protein